MLCSRGSGLSPFWSSFRHYMCLQLRWMEPLHKALETAQKALAFTLVPTSAALSNVPHGTCPLKMQHDLYPPSCFARAVSFNCQNPTQFKLSLREDFPVHTSSNIDWPNHLLPFGPWHFVLGLFCSIVHKSL